MNHNRKNLALWVGCMTLAGSTPLVVPAVAHAQITDDEMDKRIQEALKDENVLKLVQCYATGVAVRDMFLKMQTRTGGCLDGGKATRGEPFVCGQVQPVKSYSLFGLQGYQLFPVPAFKCTECDRDKAKPLANPCNINVDVIETVDINLSAGFQGVVYHGSVNAGYKQKLEMNVTIKGTGEKTDPKDVDNANGHDGPVEIVQSYQNVTFGYSVKKSHAVELAGGGGNKLVGFEAKLNATKLSECRVSVGGGAFVSVMQINRDCKDQKHVPFEPSLVDACPVLTPSKPDPAPSSSAPAPGSPPPAPSTSASTKM